MKQSYQLIYDTSFYTQNAKQLREKIIIFTT